MKLFFTLLLLATTVSGWAQEATLPPLPLDAHTGLITYSEVVPTPGVTQATLLARARVWANRVSVPAKPPLVVNELGTDVLVVAVLQQLPPSETLNTTRLYFLAQLSLREGRYQYRLEEFTFELSLGSLMPAEKLLIAAPTATKSEKRTVAQVRAQFEQAMGQAGATLRASMATPLVPLDVHGTDW